jgi:hypothetical protein
MHGKQNARRFFAGRFALLMKVVGRFHVYINNLSLSIFSISSNFLGKKQYLARYLHLGKVFPCGNEPDDPVNEFYRRVRVLSRAPSFGRGFNSRVCFNHRAGCTHHFFATQLCAEPLGAILRRFVSQVGHRTLGPRCLLTHTTVVSCLHVEAERSACGYRFGRRTDIRVISNLLPRFVG